MAAREAAHKAALVEASWCRILKAARIQSKEAEALLLKSEKAASEAFEAATAMGVVMYDTPNSPQKRCEIETTCVNGGASTTHTVTASFETAFEVDKEAAAAVKTAFVRLARCPSFSKYEFRDLLYTISESPDTGDSNQELSELSSECESKSGSELETTSQKDGFGSQELDFPVVGVTQSKSKWKPSFEKFNMVKLVDMMVERLRCLEEHELSSLANIVATCGLNAALAEIQNRKTHPPNSVLNFARRMSSLGVGTMRNANFENVKDGPVRRKQIESELPSLDKFLVKHTSKLEREVQEAKNSRKKESREITGENPDKLANYGKLSVTRRKEDVPELPCLDKFLVKRVSRLEEEVQKEKSRRINGSVEGGSTADLKKNIEPSTSISQSEKNGIPTSGGELLERNIDLNMEDDRLSEMAENELKAGTEETVDSLEKIVVKPV